MKPNLNDLLQQRQALVQQMQSIHRLRRGTLSRQFLRSNPSGSAVRRGPYYVLQGYVRGKKFSQRIPRDQTAQVQKDVDNYRRFHALAEAYITLSDQITRLLDQARPPRSAL